MNLAPALCTAVRIRYFICLSLDSYIPLQSASKQVRVCMHFGRSIYWLTCFATSFVNVSLRIHT